MSYPVSNYILPSYFCLEINTDVNQDNNTVHKININLEIRCIRQGTKKYSVFFFRAQYFKFCKTSLPYTSHTYMYTFVAMLIMRIVF